MVEYLIIVIKFVMGGMELELQDAFIHISTGWSKKKFMIESVA